MNIKIKLDTTILQSNTSMHLVQYMIEQRNAIVRLYNNEKVSPTQMKELQEDFEYIMKKHADALHKRCGTNIYPINNGYKITMSTKELELDHEDDDRDQRWEDENVDTL